MYTVAICAVVLATLLWRGSDLIEFIYLRLLRHWTKHRRADYTPNVDFLENCKLSDQMIAKAAKLVKEAKTPVVILRDEKKAMVLRDTAGYKKGKVQVDVSRSEVVGLDLDAMTVTVDPSIPMGKLFTALKPYNVALLIVPEFRCLTVGGLIVGAGIESSSFQYGFFYEQCVRYELILGTGEVVVASPTERADLFFGLPFSYGSLGILVRVTLKLRHIKPYTRVHMTSRQVGTNCDSVSALFMKYCTETNNNLMITSPKYDFVEGIAFSARDIIMLCGNLQDNYDAWKPLVAPDTDKIVFYNEVEARQKRGDTYIDMTTEDYYFRHDRGAFWIHDQAFGKDCWMGHHTDASDKAYVPKAMVDFLAAARGTEVQDAVIPMHNTSANKDSPADEMFKFSAANYGVWPLWLCPCKSLECTADERLQWYKQTLDALRTANKDADREVVVSAILESTATTLLAFLASRYNGSLSGLADVFRPSVEANLDCLLHAGVDKTHAFDANADKMQDDDEIRKLLGKFVLRRNHRSIIRSLGPQEYLLDIGIYGRNKLSTTERKRVLADFEKLAYTGGGLMGSYAFSTLSRSYYNNTVLQYKTYQQLRKKYGATGMFPEIADKLCDH